MSVWCVWTEDGDYEQHSRDLRGIFASRDLAEAHAQQLRDADAPDVTEVIEDEILTELPVRVPFIRYAAHVLPDGTEDFGLGYQRGRMFDTWSNEIRPLNKSRVEPWRTRDVADLYIEVIGSDEAVVAAEYARLLANPAPSRSEVE